MGLNRPLTSSDVQEVRSGLPPTMGHELGPGVGGGGGVGTCASSDLTMLGKKSVVSSAMLAVELGSLGLVGVCTGD